jgi:ABC-2 type transport system ATP-binding protein
VLEVRGVTKRFSGTGGISALNLTVLPGELMGLVGANGAGKSTSLKAICGLLEPESGHVLLNGHDVHASPVQAKHHLGYVPDGHDLPDLVTMAEYFEFVGALRGLPRGESIARGKAIMELLHAEQYLDSYLGTLSHGTKKKVQIVGALVGKPRLLVLDEPTSGLDAETQAVFKELIKACRNRGMAILMASHNLMAAESLCDSVTLIHQSECLFSGPMFELLKGERNLEDAVLSLARGTEWRQEVAHTVDRLAL